MLQPFASHLIIELKAIMTKVATIRFFIFTEQMFFSRSAATKTTKAKLYSVEFESEMILSNRTRTEEAFLLCEL